MFTPIFSHCFFNSIIVYSQIYFLCTILIVNPVNKQISFCFCFANYGNLIKAVFLCHLLLQMTSADIVQMGKHYVFNTTWVRYFSTFHFFIETYRDDLYEVRKKVWSVKYHSQHCRDFREFNFSALLLRYSYTENIYVILIYS